MENIKNNFNQYKDLIQQNSLLGPPVRASLRINNCCNSNCQYCWAWKQPIIDPPIEDLIFAVDQLAELGVYGISVTGGEPLIYKKISQLVKYISDKRIICIILTNGLLLSKYEKVFPLLEAGVNLFCLSLDTINPETYRTIRGVRLEPVLEGLEYILEQKKKQFHKLNISVNCVISKANVHQLDDLVKYLSGRGVSVDFQALHPSFGTHLKEIESLKFKEEDLPILHKLVEKLFKMKQDGYLIDSNDAYLNGFPDFQVYRKLPKDFKCTSGFTMLAVDYHLDVMSCWPMRPIGNLHKTMLSKLWQSEIYNKRRLEMLDVKCSGCWLRCHTEHNTEETLEKFNQWNMKFKKK